LHIVGAAVGTIDGTRTKVGDFMELTHRGGPEGGLEGREPRAPFS